MQNEGINITNLPQTNLPEGYGGNLVPLSSYPLSGVLAVSSVKEKGPYTGSSRDLSAIANQYGLDNNAITHIGRLATKHPEVFEEYKERIKAIENTLKNAGQQDREVTWEDLISSYVGGIFPLNQGQPDTFTSRLVLTAESLKEFIGMLVNQPPNLQTTYNRGLAALALAVGSSALSPIITEAKDYPPKVEQGDVGSVVNDTAPNTVYLPSTEVLGEQSVDLAVASTLNGENLTVTELKKTLGLEGVGINISTENIEGLDFTVISGDFDDNLKDHLTKRAKEVGLNSQRLVLRSFREVVAADGQKTAELEDFFVQIPDEFVTELSKDDVSQDFLEALKDSAARGSESTAPLCWSATECDPGADTYDYDPTCRNFGDTVLTNEGGRVFARIPYNPSKGGQFGGITTEYRADIPPGYVGYRFSRRNNTDANEQHVHLGFFSYNNDLVVLYSIRMPPSTRWLGGDFQLRLDEPVIGGLSHGIYLDGAGPGQHGDLDKVVFESGNTTCLQLPAVSLERSTGTLYPVSIDRSQMSQIMGVAEENLSEDLVANFFGVDIKNVILIDRDTTNNAPEFVYMLNLTGNTYNFGELTNDVITNKTFIEYDELADSKGSIIPEGKYKIVTINGENYLIWNKNENMASTVGGLASYLGIDIGGKIIDTDYLNGEFLTNVLEKTGLKDGDISLFYDSLNPLNSKIFLKPNTTELTYAEDGEEVRLNLPYQLGRGIRSLKDVQAELQNFFNDNGGVLVLDENLLRFLESNNIPLTKFGLLTEASSAAAFALNAIPRSKVNDLLATLKDGGIAVPPALSYLASNPSLAVPLASLAYAGAGLAISPWVITKFAKLDGEPMRHKVYLTSTDINGDLITTPLDMYNHNSLHSIYQKYPQKDLVAVNLLNSLIDPEVNLDDIPLVARFHMFNDINNATGSIALVEKSVALNYGLGEIPTFSIDYLNIDNQQAFDSWLLGQHRLFSEYVKAIDVERVKNDLLQGYGFESTYLQSVFMALNKLGAPYARWLLNKFEVDGYENGGTDFRFEDTFTSQLLYNLTTGDTNNTNNPLKYADTVNLIKTIYGLAGEDYINNNSRLKAAKKFLEDFDPYWFLPEIAFDAEGNLINKEPIVHFALGKAINGISLAELYSMVPDGGLTINQIYPTKEDYQQVLSLYGEKFVVELLQSFTEDTITGDYNVDKGVSINGRGVVPLPNEVLDKIRKLPGFRYGAVVGPESYITPLPDPSQNWSDVTGEMTSRQEEISQLTKLEGVSLRNMTEALGSIFEASTRASKEGKEAHYIELANLSFFEEKGTSVIELINDPVNSIPLLQSKLQQMFDKGEITSFPELLAGKDEVGYIRWALEGSNIPLLEAWRFLVANDFVFNGNQKMAPGLSYEVSDGQLTIKVDAKPEEFNSRADLIEHLTGHTAVLSGILYAPGIGRELVYGDLIRREFGTPVPNDEYFILALMWSQQTSTSLNFLAADVSSMSRELSMALSDASYESYEEVMNALTNPFIKDHDALNIFKANLLSGDVGEENTLVPSLQQLRIKISDYYHIHFHLYDRFLHMAVGEGFNLEYFPVEENTNPDNSPRASSVKKTNQAKKALSRVANTKKLVNKSTRAGREKSWRELGESTASL